MNNSFSTLINDFLLYLKIEKNLSQNTIVSYEHDLIQFNEYLKKYFQKNEIELNDLKNLKIEIILKFFENLRNELKEKESSIARKLSAIKAFFKFLSLENLIDENYTFLILTPHFNRKLPVYLSPYEVELLLNAPDTNKLEGIRDKAILELLYATGLRVSELINLKINDINFEEKLLLVKGKGSKYRWVPFSDTAKNWLLLYYQNVRHKLNKTALADDTFFLNSKGEKFTRQGINYLLDYYSKKIGLQKKISPHKLRHSFATHLLLNGSDIRFVQELLGHSNISTTQIYTYVTNLKLREEFHKYHPHG
ncbi:MAG TPA: tyrosine recombinase [bacterium]|nr:tyrosine recombinase [bacterium]HOL48282.1 tyrosine recombinase [bacterium]HPQ18737.1 tyrosine recombinase [bacterium]